MNKLLIKSFSNGTIRIWGGKEYIKINGEWVLNKTKKDEKMTMGEIDSLSFLTENPVPFTSGLLKKIKKETEKKGVYFKDYQELCSYLKSKKSYPTQSERYNFYHDLFAFFERKNVDCPIIIRNSNSKNIDNNDSGFISPISADKNKPAFISLNFNQLKNKDGSLNNNEFFKTLLHECVHSYTMFALDNEDSTELSASQKDAVKKIKNVFNYLKKNYKEFNPKNFYGATNVKEFVAELTDYDFISFLSKIELPKELCIERPTLIKNCFVNLIQMMGVLLGVNKPNNGARVSFNLLSQIITGYSNDMRRNFLFNEDNRFKQSEMPLYISNRKITESYELSDYAHISKITNLIEEK